MVSRSERARLETMASGRSRLPKHDESVRVVLALMAGDTVQRVEASRPQPYDGVAVAATLRRSQCGRPVRDKTREPGKLPIAAELVALSSISRKASKTRAMARRL